MNNLAFFKGKKVFLTGHTGFKGSWLSRILILSGAEVTGYALEAPVEAGQPVGSIQVFVNGDLTAENDYITADRIDIRRTWKERLWRK